MRLYYAETLACRKVAATVRYLDLPVEFVRVDFTRGDQRTPAFRAINPNGKAPVLEDGDCTLWESDAIMCHLSRRAGSDLWPQDDRQIDVLRWLMWNAHHFGRHAARLYFQRVVRPGLFNAEPDAAEVAEAEGFLRTFAAVLDDHLSTRPRLVGDSWTVADFAVANPLAWTRPAQLPLGEFAHIARWYRELEALEAWQSPWPAPSDESRAA